MSYSIGQISFAGGSDKGYLTEQKNPDYIATRLTPADNIENTAPMTFNEECLYLGGETFKLNSYYFHGKVLQLDLEQIFTITLTNYTTARTTSQFIKKIIVPAGNGWTDIDFVFTPILEGFDTLVFSLARQSIDYDETGTRFPAIIYEELSVINNDSVIKNLFGSVMKIGVQANPGTLLCINSEPIFVGKSGVYELRNGLINIDSFAVVNGAVDIGLENEMARQKANYNLNKAKKWGGQRTPSPTSSARLTATSKTRETSEFMLDYMYEVKED